jgi:hypothetical protein
VASILGHLDRSVGNDSGKGLTVGIRLAPGASQRTFSSWAAQRPAVRRPIATAL